MADGFEKVERAVERIENGIADLREKNAGREVWESNTDKRIDHIYDKKIPAIDDRIKGVDERVRSNEDFKRTLKVYGTILGLLWPLFVAYMVKVYWGG